MLHCDDATLTRNGEIPMALPAVDSIRSEVRSLQPYVPGKPIQELERELGIADAIKLASNGQVTRTRELNAAGLAYFRTSLPKLGLELTPSWANFVLARFPRSAVDISKALEHEGVIIRPMVSFGLGHDHARISVGTAAENERLVEVLRRIV